ncbi:MAG: NUDIX hydrolase [Gammaproteobacteria bacterium]|nr:NUDIX hydrolase [Gammaproteobacteria bacterium]NND39944.1 NUDIX hydrolase [Pseudomonadales bacterium]MBT8152147.1 NUDIX hydrolase [Gammaproteobacteria bacterium]NNL10523.1 NUDIX hydrolase [Pseudomonadales bacterium]NNM10655.1 NUDIX hydrolase [Pseudomonadales bacterium]
MKFCSECGESVQLRIPEGDNRERFVCGACQTIHYQNPNAVVGTIPLHVDESGQPLVLLAKRGIEPRHGYWTLPAGFLENGETSAEGALRETIEETCAKVENLQLYRVLNVARTNQIHIFFRAHLPEPSFTTTPESTEVKLFPFEQIPWRQLAFPTVHQALRDFVDEYPDGPFTPAMHDITRQSWHELDY